MLPAVSVIIPTYNYAHYIVDAINSVVQQDYLAGRIEIIVVDDGSTDNTKHVLKSFINEGIVQYFYQPNTGKASATQLAIDKSSGKYIFNLDADDYFLPGKIAAFVKIFEENEEIVHVGSPAQIFKQDNGELVVEKVPPDIVETLLDGNWLLHRFYNNNMLFGGGSTYAARASVLKSIEIPPQVDMYIDEFLILSVLPFGKSYFLQQPMSVWRVHNSNYSVGKFSKEKQVQKEHRLLNSSAAVLRYLQKHKYDESLLKIYRLQDATRRIVFKEKLKTKKVIDIFEYAREVFWQIRPKLSHVQKYHVINRLIPSDLFMLMKKLKAS